MQSSHVGTETHYVYAGQVSHVPTQVACFIDGFNKLAWWCWMDLSNPYTSKWCRRIEARPLRRKGTCKCKLQKPPWAGSWYFLNLPCMQGNTTDTANRLRFVNEYSDRHFPSRLKVYLLEQMWGNGIHFGMNIIILSNESTHKSISHAILTNNLQHFLFDIHARQIASAKLVWDGPSCPALIIFLVNKPKMFTLTTPTFIHWPLNYKTSKTLARQTAIVVSKLVPTFASLENLQHCIGIAVTADTA